MGALAHIRPADDVRDRLSEAEKAHLFDLAFAASRTGPARPDLIAAAPLIVAFAQAYVAVRDREEGLI